MARLNEGGGVKLRPVEHAWDCVKTYYVEPVLHFLRLESDPVFIEEIRFPSKDFKVHTVVVKHLEELFSENGKNRKELQTHFVNILRGYLRRLRRAAESRPDEAFLWTFDEMYKKFWTLMDWTQKWFPFVFQSNAGSSTEEKCWRQLRFDCFKEEIFHHFAERVRRVCFSVIDVNRMEENADSITLWSIRQQIIDLGEGNVEFYMAEWQDPLIEMLCCSYRLDSTKKVAQLSFWDYLEYVRQVMVQGKRVASKVFLELEEEHWEEESWPFVEAPPKQPWESLAETIEDTYLLLQHNTLFPPHCRMKGIPCFFLSTKGKDLWWLSNFYANFPRASKLFRNSFRNEVQTTSGILKELACAEFRNAQDKQTSVLNREQFNFSSFKSHALGGQKEWTLSHVSRLAELLRDYKSAISNTGDLKLHFQTDLSDVFRRHLYSNFSDLLYAKLVAAALHEAVQNRAQGRQRKKRRLNEESESKLKASLEDLVALGEHIDKDKLYLYYSSFFWDCNLMNENELEFEEMAANCIAEAFNNNMLRARFKRMALSLAESKLYHMLNGRWTLEDPSESQIHAPSIQRGCSELREIDFSVRTIASSAWSSSHQIPLRLPRCVPEIHESFQKYYEAGVENQKLIWQFHACTVYLQTNWATASSSEAGVRIIADMVQASILMLFNEKDEFSMTEILSLLLEKENSSWNHYQRGKISIETAVRDLSQRDFPLLKLQTGGEASDETLRLNQEELRCPYKTLRLPKYNIFVEQSPDRKVGVVSERDENVKLKAAIVSIMKEKRNLKHRNLVEAVFQRLQRNKLDRNYVRLKMKDCVESLIELEYIERDPHDSESYKYVA